MRRRVRNAFDRFRLLGVHQGSAAEATPLGDFVVWELDGEEQRYVTTEDGDRVTYDVIEEVS